MKWLFLLVGLLAVLIKYSDLGGDLYNIFTSIKVASDHIFNNPKAKQINRIPWSCEKSFATELVANGTPVVLQNTQVLKWEAFQQWNPEYLSSLLPNMRNIQVHPEKTQIFYEEGAPMVLPRYSNTRLSMASRHWKRSKKTIKSMSLKEVMAKIRERDGNYYYWNGDVLNAKGITGDLQPLGMLSPDGKPKYVHLWIGQQGVTAHTHYDVEHNFYVQIYGRKKWTIWEPECANDLYLFPRLSPNYRQSQVDYLTPDYTTFPKYNKDKAYEVTLEEGDLLYLPPFWFHRVESLYSPSNDIVVSVNAWTESVEQTAVNFLYNSNLYIPFADSHGHLLPSITSHFQAFSWPIHDEALKATVVLFLNQTANALFGENAIFHDLYSSRYMPIFGNLSVDEHYPCPPRLDASLRHNLEQELLSSVKVIQEAFDEVKSRGIQLLHFGNYVEDIAAWTVSVENVDLFIKDCLT